MHTLATPVGSMLFLVLVAGCAPDRDLTGFDGGTGCETVVGAALGLDELYDRSFDERQPTGCSSSGCHGTGAGDLTFRSARELWASTVNRPSRAYPAMNLVTPGDLSNSYFYWKLHASDPRPMPEGGPLLSEAQLAEVASWICGGARNAEPSDAGTDPLPDAGVEGPSITGFSPTSGVAGTPVTLTGEGFSGFPDENLVSFGGTAAVVETATATTLTTAVPEGAVTGRVLVEVAGVVGTSAVDFQVIVPNPVPQLSLVSPDLLLAGGGDASLQVTGSRFVSTSTVQWDGVSLATTFGDPTLLWATLPAALLASAGEHAVNVLSPGPGGGTSDTSIVRVLNPSPTLVAVVPAVAFAGASALTVELEGTGFVAASLVSLNGAVVPVVSVTSTRLTVEVGSQPLRAAGSLSFSVTNPPPGGGMSAPVALPVENPPPTLTSLAPASATTGAGDVTLVAEGTGFTAVSTLALDGATLPTTLRGDGRLEALVSASTTAAGGEHGIVVRNPAPGGGQSAAWAWSVLNAPPLVTSLDPSSIAVDGAPFSLTVKGTGFVRDSTVQVDGAPRPTRFVDASRLDADLETFPSVGSRAVTVLSPSPGGGVSNAVTLSVATSNAPMITGVAPSLVAADTAFELVVTGSGFVCGVARPSTLLLDGTSFTPTTCSTTRLTLAVDGLQAGSYAVTVKNGQGQSSNIRSLSVVVPNPVPALSSLLPPSAATGSAGFTLTAVGSGFVAGAVVSVDGSPRATQLVDPTRLEAQLLSSDLATTRDLTLSVTNPEPGGGRSGDVGFHVVEANRVPVVIGLSPSGVPGASGPVSVVVTGTDFLPASQVTFDGQARVTTFGSGTSLTVDLTAQDTDAVGAHAIVVNNPSPGGGSSNAFTFTVVAANPLPVLLSLSPSTAAAGGGTLAMSVGGEGFVSSSSVVFNGTTRPTSFVSDTSLGVVFTASDLANAGEYPVQVTSPAPGGGTSSALPFVVTNPSPTLTSISPSTVTTGASAFALNLLGAGFVNASVVRVDGVDRPTTRMNSTQLVAQLPADVATTTGARAVTVFNPTPGGGLSQPVTLTIASEPNPVPVVSQLSPCGAVVGAGALTVTVTGSGYGAGTTMTFNGTSVPVTLVSGTQLTAAVPASALATAPVDNAAAVVLSNPSPGGGQSAIAWFGVATRAATLAADVQPIFTASCATSGCHSGNRPSGDLALTSATVSYAALVDQPSAGCTSRKRVLACGPLSTQSDLVAKVLGRDMCGGSRMPKSAPLPAAQLQVLIDWVAQGAPR